MNAQTDQKKKKLAPRYWVEKNVTIYARLQYTDENGKKPEKYESITDKRTARNVVENMQRELENHGSETLQSDKMTFDDLAEKYAATKLIEGIYVDGVKVAGRRSTKPAMAAVNALLAYFRSKKLRSIKTSDLEAYKSHRLNTPVVVETNKKLQKLIN